MTHAALGNHEGYRGNLSGARALRRRPRRGGARGRGRGAVDSLRLQLATACILTSTASVGEIERARALYGANLDALLDESVDASGAGGRALQLDDPLTSTGSGSLGYYLIYQGHDDRALRQKLATVYWRGAPALRYSAAQSEAPAAPGRRIRVGFLSAFFFRHSVGLLMEGVITGLDRAAFEVFLLPIRPTGTCPRTRSRPACSRASSTWSTSPPRSAARSAWSESSRSTCSSSARSACTPSRAFSRSRTSRAARRRSGATPSRRGSRAPTRARRTTRRRAAASTTSCPPRCSRPSARARSASTRRGCT